MMTDGSCFFKIIDDFAQKIAESWHFKKRSFKKFSYFYLFLGFCSPIPLLFHNTDSGAVFSIIAPILLCLVVLMDFSITKMEAIYHQKSPIQAYLPFPVVILIFFWYVALFCEVVYFRSGIIFFRYYNVIALVCYVAAFLMIYGYLKLKGRPLNLHRFTEELEKFGEENEKDAPLNYITLTF
ncbi:MAG: hypothetical protein HQK83_14065, partial [Fibrobacteria bacterium]|nr:hypothetical protein [Fibrobacteria bacterium]